jgi:hypothetical protein
MTLPMPWIDKLFLKLAAVYGREFTNRYNGVDPAQVKQEWAECLSPFTKRPDALRFALDHLPSDRSPSMLQFRDLCRQAPRDNANALPEPKTAPEIVDKEMAKLVQQVFKPKDPKRWATRLEQRHKAGEKLSLIQIDAYKKALYDTQPKIDSAAA